ncbi:MAG: YabP/YqfC family sporulation protein [Blautia obeum]
MEEKKTGKVHGLTIKERKYGKLTGVQDIHSFNENEILLQTEAGKVQIKGEQLHVKSLDLEKGEAEIEGKVNSVYLTKMRRKRRTFAEKDVPVR